MASYVYESYGRILNQNGSGTTSEGKALFSENPFKYASYFHDQETNYYYLMARYYNGAQGRFLTADSSPDTNLYAYVDNDPVNNVDPNGDSWIRKSWSFVKEASGYNDVKRAIKNPSPLNIAKAAINFIPVGKVVKVAKIVGTSAKTVRAAKVNKQVKNGIIYERTNLKTGKTYIGKTIQDLEKRKKQHEKKNKEKYKMKELGRAKQGKGLDILEQKWINKKGGLKKDGGRLENKRNQVRKDKWKEYGIPGVKK